MNITPITFGKKYISNPSVRNVAEKKKEKFDFVEYNELGDSKGLEEASDMWLENGGGGYAKGIYYNMQATFIASLGGERFFGLEDKNGKIQAVCEIEPEECHKSSFDEKDKGIVIKYFEVNPLNIFNASNRKYKGLGAVLFREIVKLAKEENLDYISLIDASHGFWERMPYMKKAGNTKGNLEVCNEDYNKCIKKLDKIV